MGLFAYQAPTNKYQMPQSKNPAPWQARLPQVKFS